MYLTGEQPRHADELVGHIQALTAELLDGLPVSEPPQQLGQGADVGSLLPAGHVFLIISGQVQAWLDSRLVFTFGPGDLLGLHDHPEVPSFSYRSESDLLLQPFSQEQFRRHIYGSARLIPLYERLLVCQIILLSDALATRFHSDLDGGARYQQFAAGEELIRQGDDADNVFIIVEGYAEAYVDGHRVGDVCKDEIFGAMAVFTGEKRSATVIASEPCTVMVIPKEQFIALMHSNPKIAHSLIESLARRITLLNQEVTSLRSA